MFAYFLEIFLGFLIIVVVVRIIIYVLGDIIKQQSQFKREVVRLAGQPGGVTPTKLALEQDISVKQATKVLDKLVKEGYLEATADEKGLITYKLLDTTIKLE